jgi:DNA-binding NtrC family response regulator
MLKSRILVVDDDIEFANRVRDVLQGIYNIILCHSVKEFHKIFPTDRFALIILDMRLESEKEGLDLLREILRHDPLQAVIIATAYPDTESYLEAIQAGALTFLDKHEFSPALIARTVESILRQSDLQKRVHILERRLDAADPVEIIGASSAVVFLRERIREAVETDAPLVLVRGETGTGKTLTARNIHRMSRRRAKDPFVAITLSARLTGSIKEDLYGLNRNTLNKETKNISGILEEIGSGVIYLDEISELDASEQKRLLFAIDSGVSVSSKGKHDVRIDAQVIAATTHDLDNLCAKGVFRHDLKDRLRVFEIVAPPLREHKEDIPLLAQYFLQILFRHRRTTARTFREEALRVFELHSWPGNVRELKTVVEYAGLQAVINREGEVRMEHLPMNLTKIGSRGNTAIVAKNYLLHIARAEIELVDSAVSRFGTIGKAELARKLHYNDRFVFTRRIRRNFSLFPELALEFPELASLFSAKGRKHEKQ